MADWQETATAIGTLVTAGTVFTAAIGLYYQRIQDQRNSRAQTKQLEQAKLASQAQAYQSLLDKAERIHLTQALETVRNLQYDDYEDFHENTTPTQREHVVIVAEFFNNVQRLVDANMLDYEPVFGLWTLSILSCADHLWISGSWRNEPRSWWLNGFRHERSGVFEAADMSRWFYLGFERLCSRVKRQFDPGNSSPGNLSSLAATPPATSPPATPPATSPPATPPATSPPATPPATSPPATPPATSPPATPPATSPPATPPATSPPATPPATSPPATPPATSPPATPPSSGGSGP